MKSLAIALGLLALAGCKKDESVGDDRLIAKLKAEKDRLGPQGAPLAPAQQPQGNPLVEQLAADDRPRVLQSPQNSTVQVGNATLRIQSLETSKSVKGDRVGLTSSETFLKVALSVVSSKEEPLGFRGASLSNGTDTWPLASDVQRVAGTRGETLAIGAEKKDLVLYFELPPEQVKAGLKLVWPGPTGTPSELLLQ